ncbi:hypothetical protein [Flagellimonas sp. 2504JD4-2]
MKNLILFSIFFLSVLSIKAQWTDNGTNLTTTDNVGIGTTNPALNLEINKSFDGTTGAFILNQSQTANSRTILLMGETASGGNYGYLAHFNPNYVSNWGSYTLANSTALFGNDTNGLNLIAGNSNGKIVFGTSTTEKMRLNSVGNLGIGTTNPTHLLTLNGGASSDGARALVFEREVSGGAYNDIKASLGISGHTTQGGLRFTLSSDNGGNWNNDVLFLQAGGNVGIGTSDPEEQLDVNGKIQVDHLIRVNAASTTEGGEIGLDGPSGYNDWRIDNRVGHFRLHHSGTVHLQLNNNGNLGIGTTSTGSHKLAVEGSIGAREVKVEASGWSDFVFEKDYDLPTLEEVENHIKTNGHLKDIPSAKEVEENGVLLGEMNAKLLQKIEELMLYTIEQQKEIKELRSRLEKLETK